MGIDRIARNDKRVRVTQVKNNTGDSILKNLMFHFRYVDGEYKTTHFSFFAIGCLDRRIEGQKITVRMPVLPQVNMHQARYVLMDRKFRCDLSSFKDRTMDYGDQSEAPERKPRS